MSRSAIIIAIDGPAASGKSSTARRVAEKLGYLYIDSGAMYRAVTLLALETGCNVDDPEALAKLADNAKIKFVVHNKQNRTFLNNVDVSEAIRRPVVTDHIGPIAGHPDIRSAMVRQQQAMGKHGGVVMDGRDITTVVFPDAELKVFMEASPEERARRRIKELSEQESKTDFETVLAAIVKRDHDDRNRTHGPLLEADDALKIDTTAMSLDDQVELIYQRAQEIIAS